MIRYKTVTGRAALIRAPQLGGKALPFGADVVDASGLSIGVVAQDSRIFARRLEESGTLFVKWGAAGAEQCKIDYVLPKKAARGADAYLSMQAHCAPANENVGADLGALDFAK
ncbi:FimD/PapC C-terminal domain-containing protein [Paraburkholderia dipogonis]